MLSDVPKQKGTSGSEDYEHCHGCIVTKGKGQGVKLGGGGGGGRGGGARFAHSTKTERGGGSRFCRSVDSCTHQNIQAGCGCELVM